jgi:hypothetical protein
LIDFYLRRVQCGSLASLQICLCFHYVAADLFWKTQSGMLYDVVRKNLQRPCVVTKSWKTVNYMINVTVNRDLWIMVLVHVLTDRFQFGSIVFASNPRVSYHLLSVRCYNRFLQENTVLP